MPVFLVVDPDDMSFEAINNESAVQGGAVLNPKIKNWQAFLCCNPL
jgi:hypothetical protein